MPRHGLDKPARVAGVRRSPSAARAHAAGEVTWVIDLGQSTHRVHRAARRNASRTMAGLSAVAAGLWILDLAMLLRG